MPYNPGLTCHWNLQAPNGFVVVIDFFNVSIGSTDCLNFTLFNDTTQHLSSRICGSDLTVSDVAKQIDLTFTSSSEDLTFHMGFHFTFEFVNVTGETLGDWK
jgi:hypothetical protein